MDWTPHRTHIAALVVALVLAAGCAGKSVDPTVIPENMPDFEQQLDKGQIFTSALPVEGSPARLGKVIGLVEAPPADVWKVITRYQDWPKFLPLVVEGKIEKDEGASCQVYLRYEGKLGGLNLSSVIPVDYWTRLRMNHQPRIFHVDWDMVEGDIVNTYGSWDLLPVGPGGKKTKVTYQLYFEVGNAVLDSGAKFLDESILPMVITTLRKRIGEINLAQVDTPNCAKPQVRSTLDQNVKDAFEGLELE